MDSPLIERQALCLFQYIREHLPHQLAAASCFPFGQTAGIYQERHGIQRSGGFKRDRDLAGFSRTFQEARFQEEIRVVGDGDQDLSR